MKERNKNNENVIAEENMHAPWMEIVVWVLWFTKQTLSNQIEQCNTSEWPVEPLKIDLRNIAVPWRIEKLQKDNQRGSQSMCGL